MIIRHPPKCMFRSIAHNVSILQSDRPFAVFCGTNEWFVQVPPLSTLGMVHLFPEVLDTSLVNYTYTVYIAVINDKTTLTFDGFDVPTVDASRGLHMYQIVRMHIRFTTKLD